MTMTLDGTNGVTFNDTSLQGAAASPYVLKNRIINGAMVIDQRNAGASVTPTSDGTYVLDRWECGLSQASKYSVQQQTSVVPTEYTYATKITSLSSYSLSASDYFLYSQKIEGFNIADLAWGTANAKTVTLSFQVYSSLTGTFGGAIHNGAGNRSYPFSYTISSANTWTTISITIPGDTSGTWLTTNGIGMWVRFGLGVGSTYSGTANIWANTLYVSVPGATSVVGTNGATWYVTGVQLEIGSTATPFERRLYNQELANCQRYYYQIIGGGTNSFAAVGSVGAATATVAVVVTPLPVSMRTTPTVNYSGTINIDCGAGSNGTISSMGTTYGSTGTVWYSVNTSGMTAGKGGVAYTSNASTNYMTYSSEL